MKQAISFLLVLMCLLYLPGCNSAEDLKSANFYYVRNSYVYGRGDGVMAAEIRSIEEFCNDQEILREYMYGPQDASLASPFPAGIEIKNFTRKEDTLYVTLSAHIVTLPKAKQVLACACLARTAMELTGAKSVHFQTDDTDFARMEPLFIDENSILLYDDYNSPVPNEP